MVLKRQCGSLGSLNCGFGETHVWVSQRLAFLDLTPT
jgi:hypothetical protein